MKRFFFDVRQGGALRRDIDGTMFDNLAQAKREAIVTLCEIALDYLPSDGDSYELVISIREAPTTDYVLNVRLAFALG